MKKQKIKNRVTLAIKVIFIAVIFVLLFFSANSALASAIKIEPLHKVLQSVQNIKDLWGHTRNLVNVVVIAALIYVAFMNILRLQINNFAIKKILPTLILAIILANFSYFICRILIDFANVLIDLLMNGVQGATGASGTVNSSSVGVAGAFDFTNNTKFPIDPNNLNRSFIFILAEFVGGVMILILAFLFFLRNYVIYFLIVLGPLAFMSLVLPQTKKLFDQWWSQMLKWIYLPVISIFWLWLGGMWYSSGFTSSGGSVESTRDGDLNSAVLALAFAIVCYYLAITTPFKVGGAIMGKYGDLGKKAWGKTGGAAWNATGGAAINSGKKWVNDKYNNTKTNVKDWAREKVPVVRNISDSIERGKIRQQTLENVFEKRKFLREQRALAQEVGSGRWDETYTDRNGQTKLKHPEIRKRLKAMELKYFLDDERDPSYANKDVDTLDGNLVYARDANGNRRVANDRDILSGNVPLERRDGRAITANEMRTIDDRIKLFAEHSAAAAELTTRARSTSRDLPGASGNRPSDIIADGNIGRLDHRTMGVSGVGSNGPIDPDVLAGAVIPPPPPPTGGGGQQASQPPMSPEEARDAARQVNEKMSVEQHEKIAEGLNGGGVEVLNVTAENVEAHTQSAGLNIPLSALKKFAEDATQSNMQIADEIRGRVNEKNNLAHSEALVSSGIMSQLAETPRAKDRVNDLLQIARDGQAGLGQNNSEELGNAVAAAQLINPDSAVLLEGMQRRGETDKLEGHVTRILSTAERQLDDLSKKNGVVLAEQISDFKQKGAGEWQKQAIAESMKDAPQQVHREIIVEQLGNRLTNLPQTASSEELQQALRQGFDSLVASNGELHQTLENLSSEDHTKAIEEVHKGLSDTLDKTLRGAFPTMNDGDRLDVVKMKDAMTGALSNSQVTENLARAFGKSMNKSLETTNQMLKKGAKNMDIRPPAN